MRFLRLNSLIYKPQTYQLLLVIHPPPSPSPSPKKQILCRTKLTFISTPWVNKMKESWSSCVAEGYPNTLTFRLCCLNFCATALKRAACK